MCSVCIAPQKYMLEIEPDNRSWATGSGINSKCNFDSIRPKSFGSISAQGNHKNFDNEKGRTAPSQ